MGTGLVSQDSIMPDTWCGSKLSHRGSGFCFFVLEMDRYYFHT